MFANVLNGVRETVRNYRMVLLIWAWYAMMAATAAAPALNWWRRAFDHSIEASTLLGGFNFAVLADLIKYDYVGAFGLLTSGLTGAMMLAVGASSFIMGGMLKVISGTGASRGLMHRCIVGAGYFFWRFFRLMLIGGTCTVAAGVVIMLALFAVESPLFANASEAATYAWLVFNLIVLAMSCGLFLLALDYARIQVVIDDARGMFRVYFRAPGFVARHAITAYGMAVLVVVAVAALMLGYVAYETVSPVASSWTLLILLFAMQQVILVLRVGLRVSLIDAEFRYAERMTGTAALEAARTSAT